MGLLLACKWEGKEYDIESIAMSGFNAEKCEILYKLVLFPQDTFNRVVFDNITAEKISNEFHWPISR